MAGDDGEPEFPALQKKARLYFNLGADKLALRVYEDLASNGDVRRLVFVAESCREQGRFGEAIPFLLRALARIDGGAATELDMDKDALRAALAVPARRGLRTQPGAMTRRRISSGRCSRSSPRTVTP